MKPSVTGPYIKKQIEAVGQDKIVTALNKILDDMNILVGKPWKFNVNANTAPAQTAIEKILDANLTKTINVKVNPTVSGGAALNQIISNLGNPPGHAKGGAARDGWFWVGEGGAGARPELVNKAGSDVKIFSYPQSKKLAESFGIPVPDGGYINGTGAAARDVFATSTGRGEIDGSTIMLDGDACLL